MQAFPIVEVVKDGYFSLLSCSYTGLNPLFLGRQGLPALRFVYFVYPILQAFDQSLDDPFRLISPQVLD